MLNKVQHKRILDVLKKDFLRRANWNRECKIWLDGFDSLNEDEQEELLIHFYDCQGLTITKEINKFNPYIHIPYFGNFKTIEHKVYYHQNKHLFEGKEYKDVAEDIARMIYTNKMKDEKRK